MGIAAECNRITRADYLEEIVKSNNLPSNTWGEEDEEDPAPCNTREDKNSCLGSTDEVSCRGCLLAWVLPKRLYTNSVFVVPNNRSMTEPKRGLPPGLVFLMQW